MSSTKASSLKWAIDELTKQREEFNNKLQIAQKRDETQTLIDEVMAQKTALEQRISALQDGFSESSELVDAPSAELQSEMSKIDEKLDIAKERLTAIEQEEYLEELGNKLNRSHSSETSPQESFDKALDSPVHSLIEDLDLPSVDSESANLSPHASSDSSVQSSVQPIPSNLNPLSPTLMKATSNRIQETVDSNDQDKTSETSMNPAPKTDSLSSPLSLEQTAMELGIEPDFLAEKGLQAILRMISRNNGQLRFPLEVDQVD